MTDTTRPTMAELAVLAPIRRFALPIALLTIATAGIAGYMAVKETPVYPVRTELLVRIGYEYTPVPTGTAGEYQQVTFRADEVIGTEIQLLTSVGVIERALSQVPHPGMKASDDPLPVDTAVQQVQRRLAVKRIEGSNVILAELSDPDTAWAAAYLAALTDAYRQERNRLFGQQAYTELLDRRETAAAETIARLDAERIGLAGRVRDSVVSLATTGRAMSLYGDAAAPERFAAALAGLRLVIGHLQGASEVTRLLETLAMAEPLAFSPDGSEVDPAWAGTQVPEEIEGFDVLAKDIVDLDRIGKQIADLQVELATIRAARLRQDLRDEASRNVVIMSPPYQLVTPNGLSVVAKPVLAGFVAFVLSSLLFIFITGYARVTAGGGRQ